MQSGQTETEAQTQIYTKYIERVLVQTVSKTQQSTLWKWEEKAQITGKQSVYLIVHCLASLIFPRHLYGKISVVILLSSFAFLCNAICYDSYSAQSLMQDLLSNA